MLWLRAQTLALGTALGKEFSICTQSCIVAGNMDDASTRHTAKPGRHCRILAAVWIWRVGRAGKAGRPVKGDGLCPSSSHHPEG